MKPVAAGLPNGKEQPPGSRLDTSAVSNGGAGDGVTDANQLESKDMRLQLQQLLLSTDLVLRGRVGSVESSGAYLDELAPILAGALRDGSANQLAHTLEGIKRMKDRDIDQICSGDHNEYMASVEELSRVAKDAGVVRQQLHGLASQISATGDDLAAKKQAYVEAKRAHDNVSEAVGALTACLQVLELTNNVHQLLEEKRKFAALQSLEDLQTVHLKAVKAYGFARIINRSVPALRAKVTTETQNDIQGWLRELQDYNAVVGQDVFERVEKQRAEWKRCQQKNRTLDKYKFNSPVELVFRETGTNYLSSDSTVKIDFSHLYECVLVYSSMKNLPQFVKYFENDRRVQCDWLLPDSITLSLGDNVDDSLAQLRTILHNVAGFCIIDRTISRQIPMLRSAKDTDEIWATLGRKLTKILVAEIDKVESESTLIQVKNVLAVFMHAMGSYRFDTRSVADIIMELFERYSKRLIAAFDESFYGILQKDDYMPLSVSTPELYDKICRVSWYTPTEKELNRVPRVFPFSETYPITCQDVQKLINRHTEFLGDIQHDAVRSEDTLRDAVDKVLMGTVCQSLEARVKSRATTREQIVQILINLEYFERAADELQKLIARKRTSNRRGKVVLEARQAFMSARKSAENRVFENVKNVVDDFLDLSDYEWNSREIATQPSSNLVEMAQFLTTMVNSSFVNLPANIRSWVYIDAIDHLSNRLLQFLQEAPRNTTVEAVSSFDTDIKFLEKFVSELEAESPGVGTTILPLRQSVDLLLSDDVNEYNNMEIRYKKYDRLPPDVALELFSKVSQDRHIKELQAAGEPGSPSPSVGSRTGSPRISSGSASAAAKFKSYYRKGIDKLYDKDATDR